MTTLPATSRDGERGRRTFVCAYDYRDAAGTRIFQKVRFAVVGGDRDKTFRYRYRPQNLTELGASSDGWLYGKPAGADSLLYRLPEVRGALAKGRDVWWAEGEKDADALAGLGAVTTSHHGGAGHVTAEQAAIFHPYRLSSRTRIWLLADRDLRGMHDVVLRYDLLRAIEVPAARIQILRAQGPVGKVNDAADHIAAGHGLSDFVPVDLGRARVHAAQADLGGSGTGYPPIPGKR